MMEKSTMCKGIHWKIPIFMLKSVGKFHCGYYNVLEMSAVPEGIRNSSALLFGPATSTINVGILHQSL
jgi:hypothetical protein